MPAGVLGRAICGRKCENCDVHIAAGALRVSVKPTTHNTAPNRDSTTGGYTFFHIGCYPENPSHLCGFRLLTREEQELVLSYKKGCKNDVKKKKSTKGKGTPKKPPRPKKGATLGLGRKQLAEKTNSTRAASVSSTRAKAKTPKKSEKKPPAAPMSPFRGFDAASLDLKSASASSFSTKWVGASPFFQSGKAKTVPASTPSNGKPEVAVSSRVSSDKSCPSTPAALAAAAKYLDGSPYTHAMGPSPHANYPHHPHRLVNHPSKTLSTPVASCNSIDSSIATTTPAQTNTIITPVPPRPTGLKRSFTDLQPRRPLVFDVDQDSMHSPAGNLFKARRTYDYESNPYPICMTPRVEEEDRLTTAATLISLCAM